MGKSIHTRYSIVPPWQRVILLLSALLLLTGPAGLGQSIDFASRITRYREVLKTPQTAVQRAGVYFQLANFYSAISEDSAAYFARQGIVLAEKLPDKHLLINLYGELGRSYESSGRSAEGLDLLRKAEALSQRYLTDSTTALTQLMLANYYTKQGNNQEALSKALAALRYVEREMPDRKPLLCKVYNSLGIIHSNIKNFPEAITYFEKQRVVGRAILGGFYIYLSSINLAEIYVKLGQFEKAEAEARRALAKARELKSSRGIGFGLGQLADIMFENHRYPEALDYGQQALAIRQQLTDKRLVGLSLISLAEIHGGLGQYDSALRYARQGTEVLRGTNDRVSTRLALDILAGLLEKTHDYAGALASRQAARQLNDSLTGISNTREVERIRASFDLERKQSQIQLLNNNLAIQQLQAGQRQKELLLARQGQRANALENQLLTRQQQVSQSQLALRVAQSKRQQTLIGQQQTQITFARQQRLMYLTILILLVGLISLMGYLAYREQKAKRLLTRQKEEISRQAGQLAELNSTKDKLFSIISHDLRSPVAHLKQDVYRLHTTARLSATLSQSVNKLESQVDQILALLTNLLDWSHSQLTGFKSTIQSIDLTDAVDEAISQLSDQIGRKQLGVVNQLPPQLVVQADKHQLHSVLRNILNNAVKFTQPGGFIRLRTHEHADTIELVVQDTGIGIGADDLARLLIDPAIRAGTAGELSTGLGLRLCRELLARQGGTLRIESQAGTGTTVRIALPAGVTDPDGAGTRVLVV